jgi:transcriptional regulator with XRE-family HTH domain
MAQRSKPLHRKRLGTAIRACRLSLKLSQEQLAEKINCHRNYVGSVERGEQNITVDMLARFAKALRTDINLLFGEPTTRV